MAVSLERVNEIELMSKMQELKRERVLRIGKYHAMQLVGYTNDAHGGWAKIREAFEMIDGDPNELHGVKLFNGDVVIFVGAPQRLTDW